MGMLADALKAPSAYSVKRDQPDRWADLMDRVDGAIIDADLRDFEAELDARPLDLPNGWRELIDERIERKRGELADEDLSNILRDRFDF